jgi:diguanylate cyclase (GGDEF)-like protein
VAVIGTSVSVEIKASVGISVYPRHGTTVDTLIIAADLAMYEAKQSGSEYAFAR